MKIKFWGTRGSLPAPLTTEQVREKILHALMESRGVELPGNEAGLKQWMDEHLPFHARATCGGNTPCVQVDPGSADYVLLDGGTGIRDFAHEYRLRHMRGSKPSFPVGTTFHVILSHLHWDHVQGLPFFYPFYVPGQKIIVYGGHDKIEESLRLQFSMPSFPVPYEVLRANISFQYVKPDETFEVAGMRVRPFAQNHPGGSFGYRFEHNGKTFVYSTDCEHKQPAMLAADYPFLNYFADADFLVFDAMYSLDEATYSKADWGHSSNVMGIELAARSRVKRLALFHHDPHHNDIEMEEVLFNTRMYAELYHQEKGRKLHGPQKFPSEVMLATDGLEVEV